MGFGLYDDDDRDKRLLSLLPSDQQPAPSDAAPAATVPAEPDATTPAPTTELAPRSGAFDYDMPMFEPRQRVELEAPPERADPGIAPTVIGGVLDVLINKGRGLPGIVAGLGKGDDAAYDNWKRKKEWATAVNGSGRAADPISQWMRQMEFADRRRRFDEGLTQRAEDRKRRDKSLALQERGVGVREAGQQLKSDAQAREIDINDPRTKATREYLYAHGAEPGTLDALDYKALSQLMPSVHQDVTTRVGSPLEAQDVAHAGRKAGAQSAATVDDRIAVAQAGQANAAQQAADLDAIKREREQQDKIADEQRKAQEHEIALAEMEAQLAKMDPNARLPGSENILKRGYRQAAGTITGQGSGYTPEEATLDNKLTTLGNQEYIRTSHNAPNTQREMDIAAATFRGNGTVGSALERVRQARAEIAKKREMEGGVREQPKAPTPRRRARGSAPKPLTPQEEADALKGLGL